MGRIRSGIDWGLWDPFEGRLAVLRGRIFVRGRIGEVFAQPNERRSRGVDSQAVDFQTSCVCPANCLSLCKPVLKQHMGICLAESKPTDMFVIIVFHLSSLAV